MEHLLPDEKIKAAPFLPLPKITGDRCGHPYTQLLFRTAQLSSCPVRV